MSVSRRNFMVSATLAGGSLAAMPMGADGASAANATVSEPCGFHRFRLGKFEITTLSDGRRAGEAPEKTYAIDQNAADVAKLLEENLLPADRFVNSFSPVLINTGETLILFDTGMGAAARPNGQGRLIASLRASGYKPEEVDLVVLSHFHGDHIGGLMEDGKPAFAKAHYACSKKEYDFWTDPARLDSPMKGGAQLVEKNVKPFADRMTFLDDGGEVVAGIRAMAAYGHTPGHLIFEVTSEGQKLMLISDTANHFVLTLQRPDWHVAFDVDKEMAAKTRRKVFALLADERLPFIGYHMPFPALAYLRRDGDGYQYVAETYQLRKD